MQQLSINDCQSTSAMPPPPPQCPPSQHHPHNIWIFDTFVVASPIETSNNGNVNRTIAKGEVLVAVEDGTMFGCPEFVRVKTHGKEAYGDWVASKALKTKTHKLYATGTRVYVRRSSCAASAKVAKFSLGAVVSQAADHVTVRFDQEGLKDLSPADADALSVVGPPLEYRARGGGTVRIPSILNPWHELGLQAAASRTECKAAYRNGVSNEPSRQRRALLALCYDMIGRTDASHYTRHPANLMSFNARHPMVMAAAGALNPPEPHSKKPDTSVLGQSAGQEPAVLQPPLVTTQNSSKLLSMLERDERSLSYTQERSHAAAGCPHCDQCSLLTAARTAYGVLQVHPRGRRIGRADAVQGREVWILRLDQGAPRVRRRRCQPAAAFGRLDCAARRVLLWPPPSGTASRLQRRRRQQEE